MRSLELDHPRSLPSSFLRASELYPDRPALELGGEAISFAELGHRARSLAATLRREEPPGAPALTAVLASRSVTAFSGVLGALLNGHGYVPLNPAFPPVRTRTMLQHAGCRTVIVGPEAADQLDRVLAGVDETLFLVLPDGGERRRLAARWPRHHVIGPEALEPPNGWSPPPTDPEGFAYLLFTSGSTGVPKGVMVTQRNVLAFVDAAVERYAITQDDRLSQMFDMTFDLSAFDMFVAWEKGACVCCPTAKQLLKPDSFIRNAALSVWFSVPSTGILLRRMGLLKPGSFPSLRWGLFCGEPLPVEVARAWAQSAPEATVENLYGPTEATIACTVHRWDPDRSPALAQMGVVPIGRPLPGMTAVVVDNQLREVEAGTDGELLLAGPQVTRGYWQDPQRTAPAFVRRPNDERTFYRTGDRARQLSDDGELVFLGRLDHQVKIAGHRVELGEVESVLRDEAGVDAVVALGWPRTESGVAGIVAFVGEPSIDGEALRRRAATRLPRYMVPQKIRSLPELPLNDNGKVDRGALGRLLEVSA